VSQPVQPMTRRADIDWIRVGAFGLLIIYHVGLYYAPWDWHVHSPRTFEWLRYGALITNPWRLTLLFLVSGVALRFMSRRMTAVQVVRARAARLIPPFLFGVLVLVPPQSWIEAMDKFGWRETFAAWWLSEFSLQGFRDGIPLNHLWFVLYIAVYSLVAVVLLLQPAVVRFLQRVFEILLTGPLLLILPIAYLAFARQSLFATYGLSNHLTTDWYNHAASLGVFLLGFVLALSDRTWANFERLRWPALGLAALALPLLISLEASPGGMVLNGLVQNSMYAIDQWATICAVLGFASRHIRQADGPLLRYLTDAVFPCYLAHQTILVVVAHQLAPLNLPVEVEAPLLATSTLGGSLLVYELVRRIGPLRQLWGLKRQPAPRAPRTAAAPAEGAARPAKAA
jgi:glucan biosynthesis protein C